ncbi:putative membrane protein SpoIIM required for sporulation [Pontibacter mucosus]|uniref:Putative membrane protein SpoIIM required for sporulation n=2 Tax=Pontibacter mucosus TaxID=1649266 RepID=A0A2T5YEA7_9BACT|nr:putative membrane protein SpoIIM required for sporulation [Pontibacter mucosus]
MALLKKAFLCSFIIWLIGFILGVHYKIDFTSLNNYGEGVSLFTQKEPLSLSLDILRNNLYVLIFNLTGVVVLGISTAINLVFNGFFLGQMISAGISNLSLGKTILIVLPHSLELLGLWLGGCVGFAGAKMLIQYFVTKDAIREDNLFLLGKVFMVAVLLTVLAAFTEVYVSMRII